MFAPSADRLQACQVDTRIADWILSAAKVLHPKPVHSMDRLLSILISKADHGVIVGEILEFSGARPQRQILIIGPR
jgi:hypothetical protein